MRQSEENIASLYQSYAADDVNQGLQILRDHISNNWQDRWFSVAGHLAPSPRPRVHGSVQASQDHGPIHTEPGDHTGAGRSQQVHPLLRQRKRGRGASAEDATLHPSPSHELPPQKRATRSNSNNMGAAGDGSPPVKIGPSRGAKLDKGKARDMGGAASVGNNPPLRRSARNAEKKKKNKLMIRK